MHTELSGSMSETFPNNFSLKLPWIGMKTFPRKMMDSLLLLKGVFAARGVIFLGFGGDNPAINKSYEISIMSVFFTPHYSHHTFDFHFKRRLIYPYDWKCSMHFWKWVHCPVQIRLRMQDLSLWNRSLTNSAVSPRHSGRGVCSDGSLWDQPF